MPNSNQIGSHNTAWRNLDLQMQDGKLSAEEVEDTTKFAGERADGRTDPWKRHSALKGDLRAAQSFKKAYIKQNRDKTFTSDERKVYKNNLNQLKSVVEELSNATRDSEVNPLKTVLRGVQDGLQVIREDYNDDWARAQLTSAKDAVVETAQAAGSAVVNTAQNAGDVVADTAQDAADIAGAAYSQGIDYASDWWNS